MCVSSAKDGPIAVNAFFRGSRASTSKWFSEAASRGLSGSVGSNVPYSAQWGPRRALSSLCILQVKLSSLMPNLPARCQILNSERKSLKSFITEEREAFKVEFQICQLLFEWKSLLIKTYFWTYFLWNILQLLFWFIGICPLCIARSYRHSSA